MTPKLRGADVLGRALSDAGVRRVFTLSGNQIMPVFDACLERDIELLHVRHEAAAVHMADAWSRLADQVGIALVTAGPGHANALSALYTARQNEAPLVLLSGHAPSARRGRGAFQEMAQATLAAELAKDAWVAREPHRLGHDLARAVRIARAGRPGPVHLSLAFDALEGTADPHAVSALTDTAFLPRPRPLEPAFAAAAVAEIRRARKPLVITGPQLMRGRTRRACMELSQALDIPVVGMESPRGVNDPSLGAFAEVLAEADLIVLIGKTLDFTLRFGEPPAIDATCRFIHVDPESEAVACSKINAGDAFIDGAVADAPAAVQALIEAAPHARGSAHDAAWLAEVNEAIAFRPSSWDGLQRDTGPIHALALCRALQSLLDAHTESVLVADGGEFGQWAQASLSAPHRLINGPAGAIGVALPYAIAARCASADAPVLALLGDGTFGFHMAELDTAVRYALPFIAVVGNDACWNAEYQIQLNSYGPERLVGCELAPTRYDQVAAALGGHGEHVTELRELAPAIERASASQQPACINVAIERHAAPVIGRG